MKFGLTTGQVARASESAEATIRNYAKSGLLPHERNAVGDRLFPPEAVEIARALRESRQPWLKRSKQEPDAA